MSDRHRANGDAIATVKLFQLLLDKDVRKTIISDAVKQETKRQLEPKLLSILESLPSTTGIYYMHNDAGDIIYIGKSKNIKKRINQHFTSDTHKSKKMQLHVASISYESMGSELAALLKESEEIKINKPIYNRALRRTVFTHGLYSFTDENGYLNLKIDKADGRKKPITTFSNLQSAKSFLFRITDEHNLCQKLTGLYPTKQNCFNYTIKTCYGACLNIEVTDAYNDRVSNVITMNSFENKNFVIIDKGRSYDERCALLIENGLFKGLTFFNLNFQINNIEVLRSLVTPMQHNKDVQHIIKNYIRKNKKLKILTF